MNILSFITLGGGGGGVMSEGVHLEWGILHFVNTAMSVIKISEFSKWVRL